LLSKRTSFAVLIPSCVALFLLILAFGNPPQALGLDPSWTEVQAWAFLHQAQWGRDLINTYGPLGFLHPTSSYVSGIFTPFVIGQIALPAAFAFAIALMFRRARILDFMLFVLAYLCCFFRMPGDVSWILTLPLATTWLINRDGAGGGATRYLMVLLVASIFAAIALTKFTTFPIWVLCVATVCAVYALEHNWRGAVLAGAVFVLALVTAWWLCGQALFDLPSYVRFGFEMASGYGHSAGLPAPIAVEIAGLAVLFVFFAACAHAAWCVRSSPAAVVSIGLTPLVALLLWLSYFTRADEFHWPGFFAAMVLLPFALLRIRRVERTPALVAALGVVIAVSAFMGFTQVPPNALLLRIPTQIGYSLRNLTHLADLHQRREAEWLAVGRSAALPQVSARVGRARIDMVTWQQGMILLNDLNYAPRPVFQSQLAATPRLARLNESYFLGPKAPDFVLFQLGAIDNRLPTGDDGLALMALLRRYRPVLSEDGFLLLQRDAAMAAVAAVEAEGRSTTAGLGDEIAVPMTHAPLVAFISGELSWLGKLYTLLLPEPALGITLHTDKGEPQHHRFVRLSASAGFLIDPLIESTHDWLKLYFGKPLAQVQGVRIDPEAPWQRVLFRRELKVSWRRLDILRADSSNASAELRRALYPGFDLEPLGPADFRVILENSREAIFLHAPASLLFAPAPGHYRISAAYGIQELAVTSPDCAKAAPDGVGISVMVLHGGKASVAWHKDIDPFRRERDRGAQRLRADNVDVEAGDQVEYRVDPGPGGSNTSCDWSYVRDLVFRPGSNARPAVDRSDAIFYDDFE
jgi:hypothetical protein